MDTNTRQGAVAASAETGRPDYLAYTVIQVDGREKAIWRQVGSAWKHKDGQGLEIRHDAVPVNGNVTLRAPRPTEATN